MVRGTGRFKGGGGAWGGGVMCWCIFISYELDCTDLTFLEKATENIYRKKRCRPYKYVGQTGKEVSKDRLNQSKVKKINMQGAN